MEDTEARDVRPPLEFVYWLWWTPPEIWPGGQFPAGAWLIGERYSLEEMPTYGDILGGGPIEAPVEWLAAQCDCAADALVRRADIEVGTGTRQPDGTLDPDRVERWIACPRYTIPEPAIHDATTEPSTMADRNSAPPIEDAPTHPIPPEAIAATTTRYRTGHPIAATASADPGQVDRGRS